MIISIQATGRILGVLAFIKETSQRVCVSYDEKEVLSIDATDKFNTITTTASITVVKEERGCGRICVDVDELVARLKLEKKVAYRLSIDGGCLHLWPANEQRDDFDSLKQVGANEQVIEAKEEFPTKFTLAHQEPIPFLELSLFGGSHIIETTLVNRHDDFLFMIDATSLSATYRYETQVASPVDIVNEIKTNVSPRFFRYIVSVVNTDTPMSIVEHGGLTFHVVEEEESLFQIKLHHVEAE
jgi:hypothetical protein